MWLAVISNRVKLPWSTYTWEWCRWTRIDPTVNVELFFFSPSTTLYSEIIGPLGHAKYFTFMWKFNFLISIFQSHTRAQSEVIGLGLWSLCPSWAWKWGGRKMVLMWSALLATRPSYQTGSTQDYRIIQYSQFYVSDLQQRPFSFVPLCKPKIHKGTPEGNDLFELYRAHWT